MADECDDRQLCKAMDDVLGQFEVSIAEARSLRILKDYDIIVIADDSASMTIKDPGMTVSRWDELEQSLRLIVSLGACFDEDGIDIYFLNREKIEGVTSAEDARLKDTFAKKPSGGTWLSKKLAKVVMDREDKVKQNESLAAKPVLLMIFTDGKPDETPKKFGVTLSKVLKAQSTSLKFRCQLFACTGNDDDIEWARQLDDELDELDFTDDYMTEKRRMDETGAFTHFTEGDWCLKAMLGAVDPSWDNPGKKPNRNRPTQRTEKTGGEMKACFKSLLIMAILGGVFYVHYAIKQIKEEL